MIELKPSKIKTLTTLGTGTIGAGWVTIFLAQGR